MNNADNVVELRDRDLEDLRRAKTFLVSPSLTARLGELIGGPIERGLKLLPRNWNDKVSQATETVLFPVAGAVSGGAVNYRFINHFQNLARAHFIIKRLEGEYGTASVREAHGGLKV
jgi:hypothetical protein